MKRGISLIVLVITIIVMIILAATVVITLSNTGVINRASQAVDLTNEASVQDLAALIWADAYLDPDKRTDIENVVKTELAEQGVTDEKWDITVSNTGIKVTSKNTVVEKVTFTFLGKVYTVDKGTTWYDFIWYGEGKKLGFESVYTPEAKDASLITPAGFPIEKEDTGDRIYLNQAIEAGVYVVDVPNSDI